MKLTARLSALVSCLLVAATLSAFVGVMPGRASSNCPSGSNYAGIGKKVPVIEVHGLNSSAKVWAPMTKVIKDNVPNAYPMTFDYGNLSRQWVSNPGIGPRLAKVIVCVANASTQAGGPGKVVMVDHSMGGLATRYAATMTPQASAVTRALGLVFTIDTPNTGSGVANVAYPVLYSVCNAAKTMANPSLNGTPCSFLSAVGGLENKSSEIDKLPRLPSSVPVMAYAGDVTLTTQFFNVKIKELHTDLIVSEKSSLWGNNLNRFGGTFTTYCSAAIDTGPSTVDALVSTVANLNNANCWHSAQTHNPQVMQLTWQEIRRYVASITTPPPAAAPAYSGTWYAHSTALTFKSGGMGNLFYRDYNACPIPMTDGYTMCNTYLNFRLSQTSQGATATVTSSFSTISNDSSSIVHGSSKIPNGTTFKLGPVIGGKIQVDMTGVPYGNGVFNVCDPNHLCGA